MSTDSRTSTSTPGRRQQRLNEEQRHQAFMMRYNGHSVAEIADHFGKSYASMYAFLNKPEMKEQFLRYLKQQEENEQLGKLQILLSLRSLLQVSIDAAMDGENPNSFRDRKMLIDKVMADRSAVLREEGRREGERLQVEITGEVAEQAGKMLELLSENLQLARVSGGYEAHVLEGEAALPKAMIGAGGADEVSQTDESETE